VKITVTDWETSRYNCSVTRG